MSYVRCKSSLYHSRILLEADRVGNGRLRGIRRWCKSRRKQKPENAHPRTERTGPWIERGGKRGEMKEASELLQKDKNKRVSVVLHCCMRCRQHVRVSGAAAPGTFCSLLQIAGDSLVGYIVQAKHPGTLQGYPARRCLSIYTYNDIHRHKASDSRLFWRPCMHPAQSDARLYRALLSWV